MLHANSKVTEMEIKNQNQTEAKPKKRVVEFGQGIKEELKKIDWTSRAELITYTKIVVISTFLFGLSVYLIDLFIQSFLGGINMLFKFFIG